VSLRQAIRIVREEFHNLELLKSTTSPESLEALDWDFAAPRHKLDELSSFAIIELFKDLEEPFHDWRLGRVIFIYSVLLEIHDYIK